MKTFNQWLESVESVSNLTRELVKNPLDQHLRMVTADALEESGEHTASFLRINDPIYNVQYFETFVRAGAILPQDRRGNPTVINEIFTWDNLMKFLRKHGLVQMHADEDGAWTRQDRQYINGHRNHRLVITLGNGRPLPNVIRNIINQILTLPR